MDKDYPTLVNGPWISTLRTYAEDWNRRGTIKGARIRSSRKLVGHHQRLRDVQETGTCREQQRNGGGDYGPAWDHHQPGRGTRSSTPGWGSIRTIGHQNRPGHTYCPGEGSYTRQHHPSLQPRRNLASRFLGKCPSTCRALPSDHLPAHT